MSNHESADEGPVRTGAGRPRPHKEEGPEPERGQTVRDQTSRYATLPKFDNGPEGRRDGLGPRRMAEGAGNAHEGEVGYRPVDGRWEVEPARRREGMLDLPRQVGLGAKGDTSHRERRKAAKQRDRRRVHGGDHVLNQQAIRPEA